ncbi:MAG: DNA topoisomerase 3 [Gracilibacteraceae bacterium]|jgi:DNA topoisomerase-3|nr:DNA topoisomerase 3 [Gracilibacteraceae bacterium]
MKLVIAEKPSVGQTIARVIGAKSRRNGYFEGAGFIVSWGFGHLIRLAHPEEYDPKYKSWDLKYLPFLPGVWKYKVIDGKQEQFQLLKELMKRPDVASVVCATDAGREGELIFRLLYKMAACKKPVERLWISSLEDKAVAEGFKNLRPGQQFENLYASADCRSKADFLVGINETRLLTRQYRTSLNAGRVQSPTLVLVVERQLAIDSFVSTEFYTVMLDAGFSLKSARIETEADARKILAACRAAGKITVTGVKQEQKTASPPKLYDLTVLQREANRLFGYTARQTLDAAQNLYEKKLLTYPRSDSRYLTADMAPLVPKLVSLAARTFQLPAPAAINAALVINDKKVSDHHALIPTENIASLPPLPETEAAVLKLVSARLLAATGEKRVYKTTAVAALCAGHEFSAKGREIITEGWKTIEAAYKASLKLAAPETGPENDLEEGAAEEEESGGGEILPALREGESREIISGEIKTGKTTPPKPFTEDTLLAAMESGASEIQLLEDAEKKGLGTPATRAGIIEKLIANKYIERQKKNLVPTEKAKSLAAVLPEPLKSAKMTAEWENALTLIARGELRREKFMRDITAFVRELCALKPSGNIRQ